MRFLLLQDTVRLDISRDCDLVYKTQKNLAAYGHGTLTYGGGTKVVQVPNELGISGECYTFDHSPLQLGKGDVGGPFYSGQSWYRADNNEVVAVGLGRWYEGTLHAAWWPQGSHYDWQKPQKPGEFDSLVAAGATAISRTIPTNPISGAAIAVGEAREGFPRFVGSTLLRRTRDLRSVGDEYLNVEFGWKPMINDLLKFSRAVKTSNKTLRQLYRDSGVNNSVRRRYQFPVETSVSSDSGLTPYNSWVPPRMCNSEPIDAWMQGTGPNPTGYFLRETTTTKTWFSGAYSYVMPPPPSTMMEKLDTWDAEANKLFGTRLTPAVVWELAPWSWAADWFSNVGDVMTNISAFGSDSLVLKYGYVMRETSYINQQSWQGYLSQHTGPPRFVKVSENFGKTSKVRIRATPFGFGIELGSLSPRQIAIGAAVGLTRSPRLSL